MYKSFEREKYPNLLDSIEITYEQAINKLKQNRYTQPPRYDKYNHTKEEDEIEHYVSVPFFSESFLRFIEHNKTIPTLYEFESQYREDNKDFYGTYSTKAYRYAIRNRVHRAYPSLVRDIMFALFLRDKLEDKGIDVIYNEKLDKDEAIDIMLCGKRNWGIHLFTKTRRAETFRAVKNNRHPDDFYNVNDIDLELNLNSNNKFGNIILYGEDDYNKLVKKCKEISE